MTDLTPIQFQDPSARADREDTRALSAAIGDTADVAAKLYQDDILLDFKEEADSIAAQSRAAMEAELATPADPAFNFDIDPSSPEAAALGSLKTELNRLGNAGRNGTSAQRALAELKIKQRLEDFTAQFPTMRRQLAQEMGQVLYGNSDMEAMGMAEMAGRGGGGVNDDVERLQKYAYDTLKVPPKYAYGTPEFLREFRSRDEQYTTAERDALRLREIQALANPNIESASIAFSGAMSSVMAQYYNEDVNGFFSELKAARESGDLERGAIARENALIQHGIATQNIHSEFEATFSGPHMRRGPYYEAALAAKERTIAQMNSINQMLMSEDMVGVSEWLSIQRAQSLFNLTKDDNHLQLGLAMFENEGYREMWKEGMLGSELIHRNTSSALDLLNKMDNLKKGEFLGMALASRTHPDQSSNAYLTRSLDLLPAYDPTTNTSAEDFAGAVNAEISAFMSPTVTYSDEEWRSSGNTAVLGTAGAIQAGYLKMGGQKNRALADDIQERLEGEAFEKAVAHAATTDVPEVREALQSALSSHYEGWQGPEKLERARTEMLQVHLGVPLRTLMTIGTEVGETGKITVKINEEYFDKVVQADKQPSRLTGLSAPGTRNALRARLERWAKDVNGLITIRKHEDVLTKGEIDYAESVNEILRLVLPSGSQLEALEESLR